MDKHVESISMLEGLLFFFLNTEVQAGQAVYDVPALVFRPDVLAVSVRHALALVRCKECGGAHILERRQLIQQKGSVYYLDPVPDNDATDESTEYLHGNEPHVTKEVSRDAVKET